MDSVPPAAATAAATAPVRYAGFWLRWVANTIDGIIISVPIVTLMMFAIMTGIISSGRHGGRWYRCRSLAGRFASCLAGDSWDAVQLRPKVTRARPAVFVPVGCRSPGNRR